MKACLFGGVIKHHVVRWIVQECRATFHRMQNAALAFDAQCFLLASFQVSDPTNQRF
jgi:hypothetical protein